MAAEALTCTCGGKSFIATPVFEVTFEQGNAEASLRLRERAQSEQLRCASCLRRVKWVKGNPTFVALNA